MVNPISHTPGQDPMQPRPFRVVRVIRETADVVTLELEAQTGPPLAFQPGQFTMLYVFGVGEVPISISGDPHKPARLVHTIRRVGLVTEALCKLGRGDVVGVRGPFGSHWPLEQARGGDVVIVAGGIGLPPLRPAIYHILHHRQDYGRVYLLYGARTPADLLFPEELKRWQHTLAHAPGASPVRVTVDRAEGGWDGAVGVVTSLIPVLPIDPLRTTALMVGPEVMMRFTISELRKRGIPEENLYLSMERNMKCAVGFCGHCQYGPHFICKDGPVLALPRVRDWITRKEV
ncbi:FAD/NAD(P)-binding protein [Meiothermus sp.]|uniref:FAD/NAD(P)-binding protein n=1 Tax=Meiothermus sp. TaxID=1955249 RepID=UPI0021DF3AFD|nr:FAD/NAD(P)-binding protein [Meiothermus sp.]GIW34314.1 MAG: oxidoreductase [Meiothermus sp.]